MSQSLTAKYRPQTFADVAGQETIKRILSRASAEDKIAPAYLFSGTRGVGKTTIARILAKAVNCEKGPAAEPCNECVHCKQITQGAAVDVVEIDGASNRGIDDARRLKEDIGYAPMQCRYKVFIIDEAHMLTREAFNALLKTLEEPPKRAAFILATTEPHKFPATIVSRCQHYAFKRLTAWEIEDHLANILTKEEVLFDTAALKLIARRAAGSVRDSMSLLGQVLALGSEKLEVEDVRSILGLAGQELFFRVMEGIEGRDSVALSKVLGEILDQGLDLGFFLRELASVWRNLFLLRQSGEAALELLELPEEEANSWLEWAPRFSIAHIHACWQLTLEGQRRVLTALEPALALELLLLNLAFLPDLLSLETISAQGGQAGAPSAPGGMAPQGAPQSAPPRGGPPPQSGFGGPGSRNFGGQPLQQPAPQQSQQPPPQQQFAPPQSAPVPPQAPSTGPGQDRRPIWEQRRIPGQQGAPQQPAPASPQPAGQDTPSEPPEPPGPALSPDQKPAPQTGTPSMPPWMTEGPDEAPEPTPADLAAASDEQPAPEEASGPRTWEGFVAYAEQAAKADGKPAPMLNGIHADVSDGSVELVCANGFQKGLLENGDKMKWLTGTVKRYFGDAVDFSVRTSKNAPQKTYKDIKAELEEEGIVQELQKELGAHLLNWGPLAGRPVK